MKLETPPPAPPLEGRGVPAGSLAEFQVADKAAAAPLPLKGGECLAGSHAEFQVADKPDFAPFREMILVQNARQLFTDPTPCPSP